MAIDEKVIRREPGRPSTGHLEGWAPAGRTRGSLRGGRDSAGRRWSGWADRLCGVTLCSPPASRYHLLAVVSEIPSTARMLGGSVPARAMTAPVRPASGGIPSLVGFWARSRRISAAYAPGFTGLPTSQTHRRRPAGGATPSGVPPCKWAPACTAARDPPGPGCDPCGSLASLAADPAWRRRVVAVERRVTGGCVASYDRGARRTPPVRGKGEAHLQVMVVLVVGSPFRPAMADSGLW
jgi:hypothetical protein